MITKCNILDGIYNHDSEFIYIDDDYYIIDSESRLKESLHKYRNEYDIVINFLGEEDIYVLVGVYEIGLYYNTCYVFINIKKIKMTEIFIRTFTHKRIDFDNIINLDDYILFDKVFNKGKNLPLLPKISTSYLSLLPKFLDNEISQYFINHCRLDSYNYIWYIDKKLTEE